MPASRLHSVCSMSADDLTHEPTIREFLTVFHARAGAALANIKRPGVLHLVSMAPDDCGMWAEAFSIGDVDAMAKAAVTNSRCGRNVYVEARTVRPGRPSERGRGKLESTIGCFAFAIDHDADTGKAGTINGHASVVVETSPPNNVHEWFFLDRALDAGEAKLLGEAIRKTSGADHCTGNVVQPFRLPGCVNFPSSKKIARGRTITSTRLVSVSDKVWTPDELAAVFSTDKTQATKTQPIRKPPCVKTQRPYPRYPPTQGDCQSEDRHQS